MGINKNYSSSNFLMKLFLLIFLVISHSLLLCALAQGIKSANNEGKIRAEEKEDRDEGKQRPNPAERGIGITGFNSHWEAFCAWIKLTSMNFCPRNFCERRRHQQKAIAGTEEKMEDAIKRSFQSGKETMEQAAVVATKMANKVVEKTKGSVSSFKGDLDAEL